MFNRKKKSRIDDLYVQINDLKHIQSVMLSDVLLVKESVIKQLESFSLSTATMSEALELIVKQLKEQNNE